MSLSCSLAFTKVLAQQISEQSLPNVLHEIYKKTQEKNLKNPSKEKTMTHFEIGVACLKNGFLMNSKDYIEEEEEIHYLKLAKQEEEKKTEWNHSLDLQENGSNGFLEWRGRRW